MSKLAEMEYHTLTHGYCMKEFDKNNWAEVIDADASFRYTFNGSYKSREEMNSLIPFNSDPFEETGL